MPSNIEIKARISDFEAMKSRARTLSGDAGTEIRQEVVLKPGQTPQEGQAIAERLMQELAIEPEQLIRGAYVDLLMAAEGDRGKGC